MIILHVAAITNTLVSGVDVAVPQHVKAQSASEQVALLNVNNIPIDNVEQQLVYQKNFRLDQLPAPFSKPDLVVFHNTYYIEFIKIAKVLKKANIPYIIIPHGALSKTAQHKKWLKKAVANLVFFNRFFIGASAIQFLSAREMDSSKYRCKGFIGTNGVAIPDATSSTKHRDEIKMVYIGRQEVHIKGLDMMIEAVSQNRELFERYNMHLDLYGPDSRGGYAQVKALISKHNVAGYVSLHDAVVGKKKEEVLLDADLFIQASRSEGMPMGILEALSYGIPCIVTEGTGLGSIINQYNAGWAAETNAKGIACAMQEAVAQKNAWDKKAEQARTLIIENFAWEKTAEAALTEYRKIVRGRRM